MDQADQACATIAQHRQEKLAQSLPTVPTRDTRSPPNVTPRTRILAVLGLHEEDAESTSACPSTGDGWMVSDFYLWMHVLHGMGRSQEWITSLKPRYLIEKYGKEDKVRDTAPDVWKPAQTKSSGFVHGDPWEERTVVLDEDTLPFAESKVTIGPDGVALLGFFIHRLEQTFAEAAKNQDPVLILIFAHGDFESPGGLYIGTESDSAGGMLSPKMLSEVHAKYPDVLVTLFMTSCYSGHWVETVEFRGNNKPTILAAAETFETAWSNSQRHAGCLFSTSTFTKLLQEPAELPSDADKDTSREYRDLTNAILSQMYRLCLPGNISDYGSTPVFSNPDNQEEFWERTGYALHDYRTNYNQLKKIPASDPHPKQDGKRFEGGLVDSSYPDIIAWEQCHPSVVDDEYPEATAGYGSTRRGLKNKTDMGYLMYRYMRSQKGSTGYLESKMLMDRIRMYYRNGLDPKGQVFLRKVLISRLVLNKFANRYAEALGLHKLPPIEEWDVSDGKHAKEYTRDTFDRFTRILTDSRIFHTFGRRMGPFYRRPAQYLASSMGLAGYNESDVIAAIKTLRHLASEKAFTDPITKHYLTSADYSKSISSLSGMLKACWAKSSAERQHGDPSIMDEAWTLPV